MTITSVTTWKPSGFSHSSFAGCGCDMIFYLPLLSAQNVRSEFLVGLSDLFKIAERYLRMFCRQRLFIERLAALTLAKMDAKPCSLINARRILDGLDVILLGHLEKLFGVRYELYCFNE